MSSESPTVADATPFWFQPDRMNSQFPELGVPLPPPTELAGVSAMTVLESAGGIDWKVLGWAAVADH